MITLEDIHRHWDFDSLCELAELSRFDSRTVWRVSAGGRNYILKSASDWECSGSGTTIIDIGHQLILRFVNTQGELCEPEARAFFSADFRGAPMQGYRSKDVFESGLMTALFFINLGDVTTNWTRITNAVRNQARIIAVLDACA